MSRDLNAASTVRASTALTGSTWGTEALGMADLEGLADLPAAALEGESDGVRTGSRGTGRGREQNEGEDRGEQVLSQGDHVGEPITSRYKFACFRLDWQDARH